MKKSLIERDRDVIWHPYSQMKTMEAPLPIVKGKGLYLIDEKGEAYMDVISSWWVTLHGHAHPHIAKKVAEQASILEHVMFAGCTHEPAVQLAERLLEVLPGKLSKVFYSDNGSTAVEVALKMAFQYWRNKNQLRTKILAFKGAYHGDTFGAMSVSERGKFTEAFAPYLFDVIFIDLPDDNNAKQVIEQATMAFLEFDIAAFIYEPAIQGAAGMRIYNPETLNSVLKICKENAALLLADEVMTGFYRTGKFFASEYMTASPDIICLSKGLTGGTMAMGVTACTEIVYENFLSEDASKTFFHGHSFTANPLSCAASLASLDVLLERETLQNIQMIATAHAAFVSKIHQLSSIESARSLGTILSIEIKTEDQAGYFNTIKLQMRSFFLERKIMIRPLGNVLYIMPPYCITKSELEIVYAAIAGFLEQLEAAQ
jgi:adenosylmethionine-8-amino-7-oxononanoate aminotransferase